MTEVRGDAQAAPTTPLRRLWWLFAAAAALAVAVPWVVAASRGGPACGDPGGVRLAALRQVSPALPPGAVIQEHVEAAPSQTSCDGRPGTEGWSDVLADWQFASTQATDQVRAHAAAQMAALHWGAASSSDTPLGPVLEWTRIIRPGTQAHAQLSLGRSGPGPLAYWELSAVAPPVGKAASGC
ncbi:MAG: hypothetical protein ACTHJ6_03205 [Oryzihumus sp.]